MTVPAIETRQLSRAFTEVQAVEGLDLTVPKGEIFGLVGPDGAGKSTTIRMLATILKPTSGTALVDGFDILTQSREVKTRIGYMSERFNLYHDLTVMENLNFFADIFRIPGGERGALIEELLQFSRLGPFANMRAEYLSGGMKQKLALSCALIHEPEVLFLDEPTAGVDPVSRRELWRILSRLHSREVTLFIATPYMDEAERCGTVGFMNKGRVTRVGSPSEIRAPLQGRVIAIQVDEAREVRDFLREIGLASSVEMYGDALHLVVPDAEKAVAGVESALKRAGVTPRSVKPIRPTMEHAFTQLASLEEAG